MKKYFIATLFLTMTFATSNAFAFSWYWGDVIQDDLKNLTDYNYTADPSEYLVYLPVVLQLDQDEFVEVVGGSLDFVLDGTRDDYYNPSTNPTGTWNLDITNQSSIFSYVTFTEDTVFSGNATFYRIRGVLDNFNTLPEGLFTDRATALNVHLMDPETGELEILTHETYIDPNTGELYSWNPTTSVYASNAISIRVSSADNPGEPSAHPVPEPATVLLFGSGLAGMFFRKIKA